MFSTFTILSACFSAFTINLLFEVSSPMIKEISLSSSQVTHSIKILQITDVHDKKFYIYKSKFFNKLKGKNPDLIVITGDLIDVNTKDYTNAYTFIESLKEISPKIFFVNGNHEWKNKHIQMFNNELSKRGVKVLNNTHEVFEKGNIEFNICGIDDFHTKHHDLKKTFKNINLNLFTILLSHSPKIITLKKSLQADLILSGHTHGGQIRVPFIGAMISSGDGFFPKYDKGVFELDKNTILYVDSGLGTRLIPVRFLNRSQVTVLNINC